ncbi:hypothetical protein HBI52_222350 [Parastagonospora nodorum]|nr:hypothetical protein HBH46_102700 [Parastagonospora nodorum]KAH4160213.1 hypothetical protein HBH43_176590 [Parastagonospora nodorum]KAH5101554.1 hypothetical protein HBH72_094380 [Parastagonospora nodorum]KAH5306828.1 hypothetical protein HBI11_118500 [Parastagonospora nodorum]KAH5490623.1 hypothetical protein HBI52_222350 [Parastagonospora nodorum]
MFHSKCPSISLNDAANTQYNVTELLLQRYQDNPKDDWDRLYKCWGYLDCGDCHRSDGFCGWCPISSTCLPLPDDGLSRAFPLLSPIRYKGICAFGSERFELRTAGLGCQVSTITFLTSIATIFSTLFGVLILRILFRFANWMIVGFRARRGGYVVCPNDEESWKGDVWVRRSESWVDLWRRMRGGQKTFEIEEVDDSFREPRRISTRGGSSKCGGMQSAERRPLLGSH